MLKVEKSITMEMYEGLHLQVYFIIKSDYFNLITMNPLLSKFIANITIQLRTEFLVETTSSIISNP